MLRIKYVMAWFFSGFFLMMTTALLGLMFYQFAAGLFSAEDITKTLLRTISTAVIALATFELGVGIGREYLTHDAQENVYSNVRRTTTRFFGVVSIALVLEALIMVIKYSKLDMAGNLYYPVAIIFGASVLLVALGLFLFLTRRADCLRV